MDKVVEHIVLMGHTLIARREYHGREIAAFAAGSIAKRVTLIQNLTDAERFWLMLHADQGLHLVGAEDRPPAP